MKIDYNQLASDYAAYRAPDSEIVDHLLAQSGVSNFSKVIEIGCGTGNYISEIQKRVHCECVGIDASQGMIDKARAGNSEISFSMERAESLSADDQTFDLAFSVDVIHHIRDLSAYFREAFRVLRNGGLLGTVTDSEGTIRQRMPLSFYFPETIEAELKRYPSVEQINRFSHDAGFQTVRSDVTARPYVLTNIDVYQQKGFSCLRLISEDAFTAGINRMKRDLQNGPIQCVSRNFVLWSKKPS